MPGGRMPHVTISMPTYRSPTLRRAVQSILDQTHQDLTLVVVNDGDDPWSALDGITDKRLIRFDLDHNRGRYYCDAVVLAACRAKWFAIHDADDWSEPTRITSLLSHTAGVRAVFGAMVVHRQRGRVIKPAKTPGDATLRNFASHCALYDVKMLRTMGPHPEWRHAWDTWMVARIMTTQPYGVDPKPLLHVDRTRPTDSSNGQTGIHTPYRDGLWRILRGAWDAGSSPSPPSDDTIAQVAADARRLAAQARRMKSRL